jgi:hypothetical protein
MAEREQANTMRRTIDPDSPIWVPGFINLIIILISLVYYLYNLEAEEYKSTGGGLGDISKTFFSNKSNR